MLADYNAIETRFERIIDWKQRYFWFTIIITTNVLTETNFESFFFFLYEISKTKTFVHLCFYVLL